MKQRGRPFEPGNKYGRGRTPGRRNKKAVILQEILDEYAPALLRKALVLALQGDVPLLRTLLERRLPRLQDSPVKLGRLPMSTTEDLLQGHEIVIKKLVSGELTPNQAEAVDCLIETHRKLVEMRDLETRLSAVEKAQTKSE